MRKLTKTLAAVSLLAPAGAYPLGIGELELHSALNQKLNAEISLLLSAGESLSNIQVNLASPEKFEEAGVSRNFFLSKINFKPLVKPDGSIVIELSSHEVLREPFLDFLIEVSWPKGSLYREFTVLVDPPATYQQNVIPVTTASRSPTVSDDKFTIVTGNSTATGWHNSDEYLTQRNDTLWEVAEKIINNDKDISVEQMMIALHEANPQAFFKDNVNALMEGKKLRVPEKDTILRLPKRQAVAEFRRQNKTWRGRVTENIVKESSTATDLALNEQSSQLKLVAPTEAEINDKVMLSSDAESTVAPVKGKLPEQENTSGLSKENLQLQARLELLEKQLVMMQKMLAVKDEQFAALQSNQTQSVVSKQVKSAKMPVETSIAKPIKPVKTVEKAKQPVETKTVVRPQAEEGIDDYYIMVGTFGATLLGLLGWVWWRQRKLEAEYSAESMFASSSEIVLPDTDQDLSLPLIDESTSYDVGTVGESSFLSEFVPGDLDSFEADQGEVDPISEADVYLAYGRYQQAEELIRQAIQDQPDRDECKIKLLEIFYTNEDKQAFDDYANELADAGKTADGDFWAKVVDMGSEINPDSSLYVLAESTDIQEPIASDGDIADFTESSEGTMSDSDQSDLDLSAINTSAEELNTDELVKEDLTLEQSDSTVNDADAENNIDFDLSSFSTEQQSDSISGTDQDNASLDFSDNSFTGNDDVETESFDISFDVEDAESSTLEDSSSFSTEQQVTEQPGDSISAADQDIVSLDFSDDAFAGSDDTETESFDFSSDVEDAESSTLEDISPLESLESFDFSTNETTELDLGRNSSGNNLEFNFDTLDASDESITENVHDENDVFDLTDMDELETKIDLAKAYIDMGDEEAAKSIAEEVLEKGSDGQKQEAQSVLAQLH